MEKGLSMLRGILLAITLLLALSACSSATETPSPIPSPEMTNTPAPTRTISIEDLTAFATYRPTVPPSWTPFTPSATPIPSQTYTPTPRPTNTPVPEAMLCNSFGYSPYAPQGFAVGIIFSVPRSMSIRIEIMNDETGELLDSTVRANEAHVILVFDPTVMPPMAYRWHATLEDANRSGLCPIEGVFVIPENAVETTAEATTESTEALAPTAAMTTPTARVRSTEETGR